MATFLTLILALLLGLLALVLLVLCTPWIVALTGATGPARLRVDIRPISARFPLHLGFESGSGEVKAKAPPPKPGKPETRRKTRRRRGGTSWAPRVRRALAALPGFLSELAAVFRIERLRLSGRLGLPDPADTGQMFGVIYPLSAMAHPSRVDIDLVPDFDGPAFDAEAEARLRIVLIRGLLPVAKFAWRVFLGRT